LPVKAVDPNKSRLGSIHQSISAGEHPVRWGRKIRAVKSVTKIRRVLYTSLVVGTTIASTGCTSGGFSLSSMNPFSRPETQVEKTSGISEAIVSSAKGTKSQLASFGGNAKKAFSKTTNAVTGVFRFGGDGAVAEEVISDPLSLSNKPAHVGPEVYVANGRLWESTGDNTKAMESYSKALQSEAGNPEALASIARLHLRQGNQQEALQYFQQAIAQAPEDAGLYNELGLTWNAAGDYPKAVSALEKSLELAPGTSKYANSLASIKFGGGDSKSAYQVLLGNNKPAIANYNMAFLHYSNGQLTEARGYLGQAIEYQNEGVADAAVKLAVDRSRSLLAQIDASLGPVAQAAPQATIAGGKFLKSDPPVQQTSQVGVTSTEVAPSAASPVVTPSATLGTDNPQLPTTPATVGESPNSLSLPQLPAAK